MLITLYYTAPKYDYGIVKCYVDTMRKRWLTMLSTLHFILSLALIINRVGVNEITNIFSHILLVINLL